MSTINTPMHGLNFSVDAQQVDKTFIPVSLDVNTSNKTKTVNYHGRSVTKQSIQTTSEPTEKALTLFERIGKKIEYGKPLLVRTIATMANNSYQNSSRLISLMKPLAVLPEFKVGMCALVTLNYISGCCADGLTTPEKDKSEAEGGGDDAELSTDIPKHSPTTDDLKSGLSDNASPSTGVIDDQGYKPCYGSDIHCGDKNNTCIHRYRLCDGTKNCPNNRDEENCVACDIPDSFPCRPARDICVKPSVVCNGVWDCWNGNDEKDCDKTPAPCYKNQFHCEDDNNMCIPKKWVCDTDSDCPNNRDELHCRTIDCNNDDDFHCEDVDNECINKNWVCDTFNDCPNNRDEINCLTPTSAENISDMQTSLLSGTQSTTEVTTQYPSSPCNSDTEFYCTDDSEPTNLSKHQTCININYQCDGTEDCLNGQDEENCTEITSSSQPFLNSLLDYTTYLPGLASDHQKEDNEKSGISTLALGVGIGVGVAAGIGTTIGAVSLWNAVKLREESLAKGETLSWKSALWGGLKDTVRFTIRSTKARPTIYMSGNKEDIEMREGFHNTVYASNPVIAPEKWQIMTTLSSEDVEVLRATPENSRLLEDQKEVFNA